MTNTQNAQEWLKKYYDKNKDQDNTLIKLDNNKDSELEGELVIDGDEYPVWKANIVKIVLNPNKGWTIINKEERVGSLTKLTIKNFPLVDWLDVSHNQLTEVNIGNLPSLKILYISYNQVNKFNVTNTNNIEIINLHSGNSPEMEITGIENNEKISFWNSTGEVAIPFRKIRLNDLTEVTAGLNIDEKKLENKSPDQVKGVIKEETEKIKAELEKGQQAQKILTELGIKDPLSEEAKGQIQALKQLQTDLNELGIGKGKLKEEVTNLRQNLELRKNLIRKMEDTIKAKLGPSNYSIVTNNPEVKAIADQIKQMNLQAQVEVPPKN
jgi:hypothetical protein